MQIERTNCYWLKSVSKNYTNMLSTSAFFDDDNDPFLNDNIQPTISPTKLGSLSDQDDSNSDSSGEYGISELIQHVIFLLL